MACGGNQEVCPAGRAPCAGGGHFVTCGSFAWVLPLVATEDLRPTGEAGG